MSPALSGSSAIPHFEGSDVVKIRDGITFDFYMRLPHICYSWISKFWPVDCSGMGDAGLTPISRTLHIVTTHSEWQLATNTSVWLRSMGSSRKDHVCPWLTTPRSSPPRPEDILLYLLGLEFYELHTGGYQSDLGPPWVYLGCSLTFILGWLPLALLTLLNYLGCSLTQCLWNISTLVWGGDTSEESGDISLGGCRLWRRRCHHHDSYGEIVIICQLTNQLTHSHLPDWLKKHTFFASYL